MYHLPIAAQVSGEEASIRCPAVGDNHCPRPKMRLNAQNISAHRKGMEFAVFKAVNCAVDLFRIRPVKIDEVRHEIRDTIVQVHVRSVSVY